MSKKEVILEVQNLNIHFRSGQNDVTAVNNISFTLQAGETLGIVGESGSGKSVTALSLLQLLPSQTAKITGSVLFFENENIQGVNLLSLSEREIRQYRGAQIAMIFQEPMSALNPVMSCGEQVLEAIRAHQQISTKDAKKRVIELFNKVKLPDPQRIYNSFPHQLSGGQKQRVMIAMAMSCNPSILIADEPTTALDVTVQKAILELIKELQLETGMAVLFITHDLGLIAELADRVLVMFKGNIVEEGLVKTIFDSPKHPYTKSLLACRPPLDVHLKRLPVISDYLELIEGTSPPAPSVISLQERKDRLIELEKAEPILTIRNLACWFPTKKNFFGKPIQWVKAVDDVSFDVFPGETLGLVGESGCGKTTLGRTILRLAEARNGEIWYKGKNLLKLTPTELIEIRKKIQIVFQDPYASLNPRMTIGAAIREPMQVHHLFSTKSQEKDRVLELMHWVGLDVNHYDRYPHEFSGGQRQRICIARALSLNPEFIICDESVSALDVSVQAQVLNLLMELREKMNFTCIFISHDLSVVKFMSDRMIVMNQGKIEEIGFSEDIYRNPQKTYTQSLINAIPKGNF